MFLCNTGENCTVRNAPLSRNDFADVNQLNNRIFSVFQLRYLFADAFAETESDNVADGFIVLAMTSEMILNNCFIGTERFDSTGWERWSSEMNEAANNSGRLWQTHSLHSE